MGLLEELAVRCEAASALDVPVLKALNYDILCELGWTSDNHDAYRPDGSRAPFGVPGYVMLLDDAMTLVPKGWNWMAGNRDQPDARAYVNNGELAFTGAGMRRNPNRAWYETTAATPALALTAASLRARHALALSKGSEG